MTDNDILSLIQKAKARDLIEQAKQFVGAIERFLG